MDIWPLIDIIRDVASDRKKQQAKESVRSARTKLTVRISERLADYVDAAVKLGLHGSTSAEVARKFIENEVERLVRDGLIKVTPPKA